MRITLVLQFNIVKAREYTAKGAKIVEVHPGQDAIIEDIYFKNYKPIEVFKCKGIEEAIKYMRRKSKIKIYGLILK